MKYYNKNGIWLVKKSKRHHGSGRRMKHKGVHKIGNKGRRKKK